MLYDFTHVWNLRTRTHEQREKMKKGERERKRQTKKQTHNFIEQAFGYQRVGVWGYEVN